MGRKQRGKALEESNETLKAMVESLKEETDRIKAENGVYHEERKTMRKKTKELEKTISELKRVNEQQNEEIERLRNVVAVRDEITGKEEHNRNRLELLEQDYHDVEAELDEVVQVKER